MTSRYFYVFLLSKYTETCEVMEQTISGKTVTEKEKELELLLQQTLHFRTGKYTVLPSWYYFNAVAEALEELKDIKQSTRGMSLIPAR